MLKYISFFVFSFLFISLFGQYKIAVKEKSVQFNDGNFNAFSVEVFELSSKEVEKLWKKEMKDMKANVSTKKNEMKGDDARVKSMGENTFDIYAKTKQQDNGVEIAIAFDLGGAFLSSSQHADKAKEMRRRVYSFAVSATKQGIRGILKQEQKKQAELEKQQADLVKEKEKLEKNIEDWKKSIEKAKNDIQTNLKNQDKKKVEVEEQKKVVQGVEQKEKAVK